MVEQLFELLKPSSVLEEKKPIIIEACVDYYGEQRREEITNIVNNIVMVKILNNDRLRVMMDRIKDAISVDVIGTDEGIDPESFIESVDSETFQYCFISKMIKERFTGDPEISDEEFFGNYKNGMYPKAHEFYEKSKEVLKRLEPYQEEYYENQMRIDAVDRDCYKELVDKYRFLISDEDYNHYIATGVKSSDMIDFFNISVTASENFFDERSDHDLDDPNEPQWSKDLIMEARTKLAYALYSQDPRNQKRLIPYEEFMSNPDLLMYMDQAKDLATRISETKKELVSELNLRRTEAIADYQRNKKIIDSYDFVDKDMPFGPFAYMSGTSSAGENYIRTENGLVYKPIVAIDAGFVDIDETIIHEVNHEIERHVIRVDDKGFESITGWDRIETTFSDTQDNSDPSYRGITKPYEFLSEYVNDTIASEITDQMHSKGYYIFSPIRRPGCPYKIIGPLFRDFYQEYKKDIIESRSHGNIGHLYALIGQENFEELNNIANDFYKQIGFDPFIWKQWEKKEEAENQERVSIVDALVQRKNQVLEAIKKRISPVVNMG